MLDRFSGSTITLAIAATAVGAAVSVPVTPASAQAPAASVTASAPAPTPALKTPWGEPDLQGIWTNEFDTPLQRPAKYANQEFFTEAQRTELDKERTEFLNRRAVGTLNDAYNFAAFLSTKHTGARTSKIVDPPNGRTPPLTPEAQKIAAADRDFRLQQFERGAIERAERLFLNPVSDHPPQRRKIRSQSLAAPRRNSSTL